MEAIMKSCSVPTANMLAASAPKSAAYVSNAPQFFLSPNEKKGSNFPLLKLAHNKGISPLHAVPSETQVKLDNLMDQAEPTPQEPKIIHVKFRLERICNFGEQFLLVGNNPMLGSWNPSNAVPMTWSEGHVWSVDQEIPAGNVVQFKFVLKSKQGDIFWMPGPDRVLHTWEKMNKITVHVDWDTPEFQRIVEEDETTPSNEELKIVSEMPNLPENLAPPKEMMKSNGPKILKKTTR